MQVISRHQAFTKLLFSAVFLLSAGLLYANDLTLAVANSTCKAIKEVGHLYEQQHQVRINYICKSSGLLAKGLTGGAIEADIYISANRRWMDFMIGAGKIRPDQVSSPWGNELVVAAPKNSPIERFAWEDLASDKVASILIGDPGTAPFGRYAKQALQTTHLWERVRRRISTKKNITLLANSLAASGAKTVGILFLSNVTSELRIIFSIDASWHSPIHYYMAPTRHSADKEQVATLINFIQSDTAREVFSRKGFKIEATE